MEIAINGPIVDDSEAFIYDWFGMASVSPSKIKDAIAKAKAENDRTLDLKINSGGGSVFAASEIFTELKTFDGEVRGVIQSIAASAATVIGMGCSHLAMTPTGQFMIHNASNAQSGNHQDMQRNSDFLKQIDQTIANAYATKTGKETKDLIKMMDSTSWLTAQDALEHGFIDEVLFENEFSATNSVDFVDENGILPADVIAKVRNELMKKGARNDLKTSIPARKTPENKENGGKKMDLATLKNDFPDLYTQIQQGAANEAAENERQRIMAIDELAMPGNEKIIEAAKADASMTAEKVAIQLIKNQKETGFNYIKNAKKDAEETEKVDPSEEEEKKSEEEEGEQNLLNDFSAFFKGGK